MSSISLLLFLLLHFPVLVGSERVQGQQLKDACQCELDITRWFFPLDRYEEAKQMVDKCGDSLAQMQERVLLSEKKLPIISKTVSNITESLKPFQYLGRRGLYHSLYLEQLTRELEKLEGDISDANRTVPNAHTGQLSKEVAEIRKQVEQKHKDDTFNLLAVRENLRLLKNRLATSKTIDSDFRSNCSYRLLSCIGEPVVTKLSPYGKSYPSGSWGREAKEEGPEKYWVQPLVSSNRQGTVLRTYRTHDDFMASRNHVDLEVAPSVAANNAIQGPGTVLYNGVVFYQCYNAGELCRYDPDGKTTLRKAVPAVGFNNKFPYCYYSCRDWSDVDMAADEWGLWAVYATEENHGNVVLSLLEPASLNITHTWNTGLFKKAVTNTFVICGVLYATRYVSRYREEVFYAFDTTTGKEDRNLAVPMEKVSEGISSLQYNPVDRKLYMYNDAYLLAYNVY